MAATTKYIPTQTPLATSTDLRSEEVEAIAEAVNPVIADAFALYVKAKNYHWHLSGSHFRDYHLLFDEHAESLFGTIDKLEFGPKGFRNGPPQFIDGRIRISMTL